MNAKELVSFLNGAIELGNLNSLNIENFEIINNKVNSVENDNTPEGIFCTWLKGFLEASDNSIINGTQFTKISTKLYELNKNIISSNKIQSPAEMINRNYDRVKC